jgi:hypothetical protein
LSQINRGNSTNSTSTTTTNINNNNAHARANATADADADADANEDVHARVRTKPTECVFKFGGSSLADSDRIDHVAHLIQDQIALGYKPRAVVCSAMGKTTNNLLSAGEFALGMFAFAFAFGNYYAIHIYVRLTGLCVRPGWCATIVSSFFPISYQMNQRKTTFSLLRLLR